jgi:hypothetical protein
VKIPERLLTSPCWRGLFLNYQQAISIFALAFREPEETVFE